jgi:hypothetical protein
MCQDVRVMSGCLQDVFPDIFRMFHAFQTQTVHTSSCCTSVRCQCPAPACQGATCAKASLHCAMRHSMRSPEESPCQPARATFNFVSW